MKSLNQVAAEAQTAATKDEIEQLRKDLAALAMDELARGQGEKPADEWTRTDFRNMLRYHEELRSLETEELRAVFLMPTGAIAGTFYYKRGNIRDVRRIRASGGTPLCALAIPTATAYAAESGDSDACRQRFAEEMKLAKIWQKL